MELELSQKWDAFCITLCVKTSIRMVASIWFITPCLEEQPNHMSKLILMEMSHEAVAGYHSLH